MKTINRYLWLVLLAAGLLTLFACGNWKNKDRQMLKESCYKINQMVKDVDFHSGQIQEDTLVLFDKEHMPVKEIPLTDTKIPVKLLEIRKKDAIVYFIVSGDVDDEEGILFINDSSNDVLSEIKEIQRVGGNSYLYSTRE